MSCVIGTTGQSHHIAAQTSQKFNKCDFVTSTKAFIARAGIACEQWETLSAVVSPANTCMEASLYRLTIEMQLFFATNPQKVLHQEWGVA